MNCLECGKEVRNINLSHLKSCSGLTPQQYRERHPGAPLVDEEVRKSYGMPAQSNPNWKGGKTKRTCKGCGKPIHKNARGQRCVSCIDRTGAANSFYGKTHSDETRRKMVESNKDRDPSTYKGNGFSSERVSEIQEAYWSRLSPAEKTERLQSFIQAGQISNKALSKTKIENVMAQVLDSLGVGHQRNVQLGRYNVDFLARSTIVECFGDYWHCNPRLYPADFYNKSLHMTAQEKWDKDAKRAQALESQGYTFYSFWAHEIENEIGLVSLVLEGIFSAPD